MEQKDHFLDILQVLFKWKKTIFTICGVTAIGAVVIALILPVYFEASVVFYAASPDMARPEAVFGTANAEVEYYGEDEDMDRINTIANSGQLMEFLIDSFNLYQHYDIDPEVKTSPYYVEKKFRGHFTVKKTKQDALQISVEDEDPVLAANIANAAAARINAVAQEMIRYSQAKMLGTYDNGIKEGSNALQILSDSLQHVRERYGIYNTVSQSQLLSELIARSESKLSQNVSKLDIFKANPRFRDSVVIINANIEAFKNELTDLRIKLQTFNSGYALADYLNEQHEIASEEMSTMRERYKQIQAAYASDIPAIHMVEAAKEPLIKSRPHRSLLVVAATLLAFLFSVVGVLVYEHYGQLDWKRIMKGEE